VDEDLGSMDAHIVEERKRRGLEGLVGGLQAVIINTEQQMQNFTVGELLRYTGLRFNCAFLDSSYKFDFAIYVESYNYGTRVHHIAFQTEEIEDTFKALLDDGMRYPLLLVGSPKEGLKQTFTEPSPNTLLVTEYIHWYGDFDGFFTRSNVALLTAATGKQ
jgi:hypothetical protein